MAAQEEQDEHPTEDRETVLKRVQDTLESLLSKDNLQEDGFIQVNMNAQMYIPLCILAGHHQIEALGKCADVSTLLEASLRSEHMSVDKENLLVKPLIKTKRNTVILHDLPDEIAEEELNKLFDTCPVVEHLVSVKPDVNHTAFVTFETDAQAQDAALWLRSQKLRDAAVKCSIKSEQFLRSFFPMPSMSAPGAPPWAMTGGQAVMWSAAGWPQQWNGQEAWGMDASPGGWHQTDGKGDSGKDGKGKGAPKGNEKGSFETGTEKGSFAEKGYEKGSFDKGYDKGWDKGKGKGKGKGKRKGGSPLHGPMGPMDRELAHMEAMQQAAYQSPLESGGEQADALSPEDLGYKHEFRKYSRQQIIEACSSMEEVEKPESFKKMETKYPDLALFRQSPNKDWAPLPTPMTSFASSFLDGPGGRRTSSMDESDGDRGRPWKERSNTWAPSGTRRGSRSASADVKEESGDGEWDWDSWEDSKGWRSSRRWSWDEWYSSGPVWVEKSKVSAEGAQEDKEEGDKKEQRAAKRPSWAEKVRGGAQTQRWQPVSKPSESEEAPAAPAAPASAEACEISKDKEDDKEPPRNDEEASKTPTWADKVRKNSGS
eukprot:TRINITY_DN8886_c0_g1_i2.p1 TRINITY_DN8886_c0_g1~~TRINITY_DN8886_c0_g1_i2.p1  ORF type:complete len:598 (-),score=163.20 TRINITY_DN8886_c0_g1_i2:80-1873(-)